MSGLPPGTGELIERALAEDLGSGDVTAGATVPDGMEASARIVLKQHGVISGLDVALEVFRRVGVEDCEIVAMEGHWQGVVPLDVALVRGPARAVLAGERVALNFLGHLSGISTLTARFVDAVAGTRARILDTRKTTPGMRLLEKRAVSWGGGLNHRVGLYDAVLIKENHIAVAGGLTAAVDACRRERPGLMLEVEAETLAQVEEAIAAGVDRILLDNMEPRELHAAVSLRDSASDRSGTNGPELEASGGVDLGNVHEVAEAGVDFVSVGAITHSAPALDFSLLIDLP
jgi:nicotinate-nucleotide pyrophosphorylase (carboxylating)